MRAYPQFSFWISISLVKICFSRIFSKSRKNTFELVGTVLTMYIAIYAQGHATCSYHTLSFVVQFYMRLSQAHGDTILSSIYRF